MKIRKKEYGNINIIGKRVEELRKSKNIKQKDFIVKSFVLKVATELNLSLSDTM